MPKPIPKEEYLEMYLKYAVHKQSVFDIAKDHKCGEDKVYEGIKWVRKEIWEEGTTDLLKDAIESLKARIRENKEEANKHKGKHKGKWYYLNMQNIIDNEEKMLYELQRLFDKTIGIKGSLSVVSAMREIKDDEDKNPPKEPDLRGKQG